MASPLRLVKSDEMPQVKPCRTCGGELNLFQDGTYKKMDKEVPRLGYEDRMCNLLICAECDQGMARLPDGCFKCLVCQWETSFAVETKK